MPTIKELFDNTPPTTSKAKTKGVDTTPIGDDNPRGEFSPSADLSKDGSALLRARKGLVSTKKYSDSVSRD